MRLPLVVLLSLAACGPPDGPAATEVASPDLVVHVSGLACETCAASLTTALEALDGVEAVAVDLDERDQRADVALAPGHRVADAAVREAVTDAGFTMRHVERPTTPSS